MATKNDVAWETLFDRHQVLAQIERNGIYRISATTINQVREARLMTKFDQAVNLPRIFQDNNLSILPDSRGTYLIGEFTTYQKIEDDETSEIIDINFPSFIETINPANIYSEPAGLLCAFNSEIIDDLFDERTCLTVSGRMSTGKFQYRIRTRQSVAEIEVNNAQCEIDGGFESRSNLILIEAKNYGASDFLIRQLYYPYRLWLTKTMKKVVPVFMSYSNDVFSFFIYEFENYNEYNSLQLVRQKKYRIAPDPINVNDIYSVLQEAEQNPVTVVSDAPFPQADSFVRVLDLLNLILTNGSLSAEQITTEYDFDIRQTQYYSGAGMYLGLIEKKNIAGVGITYFLTEEARTILNLSIKGRNLAIARTILRNKIFARSLRLYFNESRRPTLEEIEQIMHEELGEQLNDTTIHRRSQTVLAWVIWIVKLSKE